jgi:putative transposase
MKFYPQKHHRRSIRLPEYDYSQAGAYFITLCAWRRERFFGVISDNQMKLSRLGEIIQQEWQRSAQIRREIQLDPDEFIIMPNHIHGIALIIDQVGADGIRPDNLRPEDIDPDGVFPNGSFPDDIHQGNIDAEQDGEYQEGAIQGRENQWGASLAPLRGTGGMDQPEGGVRRTPLRRKGRSLGSFVAGFKAAVTARARRELGIEGIWQCNYYEHIIRDQEEYESIRAYIQTNPLRWVDDQLHPYLMGCTRVDGRKANP